VCACVCVVSGAGGGERELTCRVVREHIYTDISWYKSAVQEEEIEHSDSLSKKSVQTRYEHIGIR